MEKLILKYSEKYIKPIFTPLNATFKKFFAPLLGKLKKVKDLPKTLLKTVQAWIKAVLDPKELKVSNYIRVGRYLVAKRLLLFLLLLACFIVYILFIKPPSYVNKWFNRFTVIHEKVGKTYKNTGKIKIISPTKTLKYEGDLVDGLYNGNGTLYNDQGGLRYKGEFKTGAKNGAGELYDDKEHLIYKGSFADDAYSGQGATYRANEQVEYEGEFKNGKPEGIGRYYYPNGALQYEGLFSNGVYNGAGKLWSELGVLLYDGNFQNGIYSGEGTDFYPNKLARYKGLFLDGKYSGAGQLLNEDGTLLYEGNFRNGEYSGAGVEHFPSGLVHYKGDFLVGQYSGLGELMNEAGIVLYKGSFFAGKFNGMGDKTNDEGLLLYSGAFKEGQYQGIGTLFAADATVLYTGFFDKDQLHPQGFLGISRTKLEAILGKPSEINVNEDLSAVDSLISNYNDLQLSFILKLSSDNPKESYVSKVIFTSTTLINRSHSELEQGYAKGNLEDIGLKQPSSDLTYSVTFKIDDALFAYIYNSQNDKLLRLEIS